MEAPRCGPLGNGDGGLLQLDCKSPVRFVGLASLIAVGAVFFSILWPLRWSLAALWLAIEALFFTFVWRPRWAMLDRQPRPHYPLSHDAMATFRRVLRYFSETSGIDTDMYYSGWFLGAKFEDIKRGNAEEFMAYAFWYRTLEEMAAEGNAHIPAQMVDELEKTWGVSTPPGYTPGLRFMGHLSEPLKATWRPLAFYLATEAVGWFARNMLMRWGFEMHTFRGFTYFTLNMGPGGKQVLGSHDTSVATASDPESRTDSGLSTISDASLPSSLGSDSTTSSTAPGADGRGGVLALTAKSSPTAACPAAQHGGSDSEGSAAPSGMVRTRSSPFEVAGLDWAGQLDADAHSLDASITAASAVHAPLPPLPPKQQQQQQPQRSQHAHLHQRRQHQQPSRVPRGEPGGRYGSRGRPPPSSSSLAPHLSSHTSALLRALHSPLEDALEDRLGGKDMPILFLHGVGGLPAYLEMLLQVLALGHPLIVLECPGVAMRFAQVSTADDVVDVVVGVLDRLGVKKAVVIGHSYGTFVAGRLARLHRKRVHNLCLIDPVCFGMFMPHLLSNFLYTAPKWRGLHHVVDFAKQMCVNVAARELHVCASFSRNFFWSDLNLWPEDLGTGSVVLLSGRDDLMNARQVQEMLTRCGHIRVHYNQELTHGEFLLRSEVKRAIMEEVRGMLARSGSAVVGLARPVLETTMTLARNVVQLGGAGGHGRVRMHIARGGSKYVEDQATRLVRTFTGNLTAMLQTVSSACGSVDSRGSGSGSSCGGPAADRVPAPSKACAGFMPSQGIKHARARSSRFGPATSRSTGSSTLVPVAAADAGLGASSTMPRTAHGAAAQHNHSLVQAFSLPVRPVERSTKRALASAAGAAPSAKAAAAGVLAPGDKQLSGLEDRRCSGGGAAVRGGLQVTCASIREDGST